MKSTRTSPPATPGNSTRPPAMCITRRDETPSKGWSSTMCPTSAKSPWSPISPSNFLSRPISVAAHGLIYARRAEECRSRRPHLCHRARGPAGQAVHPAPCPRCSEIQGRRGKRVDAQHATVLRLVRQWRDWCSSGSKQGVASRAWGRSQPAQERLALRLPRRPVLPYRSAGRQRRQVAHECRGVHASGCSARRQSFRRGRAQARTRWRPQGAPLGGVECAPACTTRSATEARRCSRWWST